MEKLAKCIKDSLLYKSITEELNHEPKEEMTKEIAELLRLKVPPSIDEEILEGYVTMLLEACEEKRSITIKTFEEASISKICQRLNRRHELIWSYYGRGYITKFDEVVPVKFNIKEQSVVVRNKQSQTIAIEIRHIIDII